MERSAHEDLITEVELTILETPSKAKTHDILRDLGLANRHDIGEVITKVTGTVSILDFEDIGYDDAVGRRAGRIE
jgi:hypothetical protein